MHHGRLYFTRPHIPETEIKQNCRRSSETKLKQPTVGSFALFQFLPARRYATAGNSDRNVSVCPSVRHEPVLCQNEES